MDNNGFFIVNQALLYVLYVIGGLGVLILIIRKIFQWSKNNHSEVIKYELKIISKKEKYALLGASVARGLSKEASPRRYYLTGETKDGQVVRCQVPYNVYDRIREDSRALVTMQGTRFIAFERLEEAVSDD